VRHHPLLSIATLVTALLAATPGVAAEKYYKWVDAQGITHYSSRPPHNQDATTVRTTNLKPDAAPATPAGDTVAAAPDAAPAAVPEKSPERCDIGRNNLRTINENPRVRTKTDDGSFRYLEPAEIEEQRQRAEKEIAENC
jgi:hypothetical protein